MNRKLKLGLWEAGCVVWAMNLVTALLLLPGGPRRQLLMGK